MADTAPSTNSTPIPASLPAVVTPVSANTPPLVSNAPGSVPSTPTNSVDETQATLKRFSDQAQTDYEQYQRDAKIPIAPPNVPHARLLNMIAGIGVALSAAGTAVGTHGREGGAPEVAAYYAQQQDQRIQAQQAAQAQKNAKLQQDLMTGEVNTQNAQNWIRLQTAPSEITNAHLDVQGKQQQLTAGTLGIIGSEQDIRAKALADFTQTGDLNAYNKTLSQLNNVGGGQAPAPGAAPAATGTTPPPAGGATTAPVAAASPAPTGTGSTPAAGAATSAPTTTIPPVAIATWRNAVDAASNAYPNDPAIKQYAAVLADPNATPQQMALAANAARNRMGALDTGVKSRTAQQEADPLFKLESDPSQMTGANAPAAIALLQSKLNDPNLPADQKPRVQRLYAMAQQAQKNELNFEAAKERTQQAITDGDPRAAGALLVSGLVSPQELISSRKPEFAQQAFDEAERLGGATKGADGLWHGGKWNAQAAEAQYEYAKNPQTQNTLNLLTTMQRPGGSIDIAQRLFSTLPGKVDEKTFNSIINGATTEFGGQSTAAFQAAMTSLADEYAQVLQGGAATQSTLSQAKDLINQAYSQNQGAAAFNTIRQDMMARQRSLVRNNPALLNMYPETYTNGPAAPADSPAAKIHASLSDFTHTYSGAKGTIYSDDLKNWYDSSGNLVQGQ